MFHQIKFFIYLFAYIIFFVFLCTKIRMAYFRVQGSSSQLGKVKDTYYRAEVMEARDNKSENQYYINAPCKLLIGRW